MTAERERKPEVECDVAVLGGGLAGMALAATLSAKGVRVVCIEPRVHNRGRVGESLDWSSPGLLAELGFGCERLVDEGFGTYKRHIRVLPSDEEAFELAPQPWFGWRPWKLELATVHLDRERFDQACLDAARRSGVCFRSERVSRIHTEGERVTGVETESALVRARRYVDAAGRARLLARAFSIPSDLHGVPKVSLWTYVPNHGIGEGTTLTLERSEQLRWLWEIPISDEVLSVGYTLPASELSARLGRERGTDSVLRAELEKHARFRGRLADRLEVHACSFQNYVHRRTCGPNWLLVGESAAMIDPLTSNGFTSALRFGAHAARLIEDTLSRPELPAAGRRRYDRQLRAMAGAFNRHIERCAYRSELREALGIRRTTLIYVLFGYFANAAYQKLRPRGRVSWLAMRSVLVLFELWVAAWGLVARLRGAGTRPAAARDPLLAPRAPATGQSQDAVLETITAALPALPVDVAPTGRPVEVASSAARSSPPPLPPRLEHVPPRDPAL